jgi:hypothetical protein
MRLVSFLNNWSQDNLLQLLKTAGDNTAMPSISAPIQILCYVLVQGQSSEGSETH